LTMRSSGPRPSDGLAAERPVCAEGASSAAGWMRPSWLHEAHSTITKSPALRSLTRAVWRGTKFATNARLPSNFACADPS
jgi:hypothetical protein